MDKIVKFFAALSVPLEWIAGRVATHPKAALIAWAISLGVVAWLF